MLQNSELKNELKPQDVQQFIQKFNKKVNVLVVDDDKDLCEMLCRDMFLSPLFNFRYVTNLNDALHLIRGSGINWNSWIIDINLKSEKDGSSLLESFPNFNFAIVFSGISTLETASNAIKKGAAAAFSKDPALFFSSDAFYNEVCKVSALSFVLKGQSLSHTDIFRPLTDKFVKSVEEWASCVNVTTRHLQRMCSYYTQLAPRALLHLYHSIYYALRESSFTEQFDAATDEDRHLERNKSFYLDCISTVLEKLDSVYKVEYRL